MHKGVAHPCAQLGDGFGVLAGSLLLMLPMSLLLRPSARSYAFARGEAIKACWLGCVAVCSGTAWRVAAQLRPTRSGPHAAA